MLSMKSVLNIVTVVNEYFGGTSVNIDMGTGCCNDTVNVEITSRAISPYIPKYSTRNDSRTIKMTISRLDGGITIDVITREFIEFGRLVDIKLYEIEFKNYELHKNRLFISDMKSNDELIKSISDILMNEKPLNESEEETSKEEE